MHTLAIVTLALGAVILILVALLRVMRDLILRADDPAPQLEAPQPEATQLDREGEGPRLSESSAVGERGIR